MTDEKQYFGMLLYGRERSDVVSKPETFEQIISCVRPLFEQTQVRMRCRGIIDGFRMRNVAPRAGVFNDRMLNCWLSRLKTLPDHERFHRFELFGPSWKPETHPLIYIALDRIEDISHVKLPDGSEAGAKCSLTVAASQEILEDPWKTMETIAKSVIRLLNAFYGYLNPSDAWDFEVGVGAFRGWMMDIRFRDTLAHNYNHPETMLDRIPNIYQGNILSDTHFVSGNAAAVSKLNQTKMEKWSNDLSYVQFHRDPQIDPTLRDQLEKYFNFAGHKLNGANAAFQ